MQTDTDHNRKEVGAQRGRFAHLFSEYPADEDLVARYWESMGCSVERLDSEDKRNPDFLLRFASGAVALCEVKSFGGPETGDSDYSLDFNADLRISNALYSGITQLIEYGNLDCNRILFFVNHNDKLRFDSLARILDGEWDPIRKSFVDTPSEQSIAARREREKIDLYLWLRDTQVSTAEAPSHYWGRLKGSDELCTAMGLRPKQLKLIHAA